VVGNIFSHPSAASDIINVDVFGQVFLCNKTNDMLYCHGTFILVSTFELNQSKTCSCRLFLNNCVVCESCQNSTGSKFPPVRQH
jgi:hypothetical protein